ncbi:MAG TPA: hypothetical protein VKU38_09610, partial [Ktedonobacteraceae bacterium]|nr:hypothetical protein [Ktedonobacteraceae bacterium]
MSQANRLPRLIILRVRGTSCRDIHGIVVVKPTSPNTPVQTCIPVSVSGLSLSIPREVTASVKTSRRLVQNALLCHLFSTHCPITIDLARAIE